MRLPDALMTCVLCFAAAPVFAQPAPCKSTATGDLHFHQLSSKIFGNTRTIRVLLPQGYSAPANSEKRYPVFYMLDGQNLFDACLSEVSHKEWQVDETMYRLAAEKAIPEMIVVGIDHAGPKRAHEWNTTRIVVNGAHVEHWLNGQKVVEYELWSPDWKAKVAASKFKAYPNYGLAKRGYIGIQGDHAGTLTLRGIRIRELSQD